MRAGAGYPMLCRIYGVKVALGSGGMTVEAARRYDQKKEGMESPGAYVDDRVLRNHYFLVSLFFRSALLRSVGLSSGEW